MFGGSKMTREEVLEYFGSFYKMRIDTGVWESNQMHWRKLGYIPLTMQYRLQAATHGALKASEADPRMEIMKSQYAHG